MKYLYILTAILLAVDNVFIKFRVGGLSLDRLLEFVLFFVFFKAFVQEVKNNKFFKTYTVFLICFAILQLLMNLKLANSGNLEFEYVYTNFVKVFSFIVFSFLFLLIAKKDLKHINIILFIHFLICLFALLQHPISPVAEPMFEIKKLLYSSIPNKEMGRLGDEEAYITGGFADRFRLSGPFAYSIGFSYFAITSFILSFYMYLRYKKKYYLVFLGVLFIASILTQTRSLILGELFLIFGYLFFAPLKQHAIYKFTLIVTAAISILAINVFKDFVDTGNTRITQLNSNNQSDIRPLLWATGIYTVISHPFGVSDNDYMEVKKEMFVKNGNSGVLQLTSHNGLINVGFNYTIFGYMLFLFFILFFLKFIHLLEPRFKLFFKLTFISYLIHTSFHNNFILDADYPFLMILMLISVDGCLFSENFYSFNNLQAKSSNKM